MNVVQVVLGLAIGLSIGLVTALSVAGLIASLVMESVAAIQGSFFRSVAVMVSTATLWFGFPWLTYQFLSNVSPADYSQLLLSYIVGLSIAFIVLLIIRLRGTLGQVMGVLGRRRLNE